MKPLLVFLCVLALIGWFWSKHHVRMVTGGENRVHDCIACHFSASGGTLMDRILAPKYRTPSGLAVCPDGQKLLVAARDAGLLLVVETVSRRIVAEYKVGRWPHSVAVDRECHRAYVTNENSDSVTVIDLSSETIKGEFPTDAAPADVVLDPERNLLFVANRLSGTVTVIDAGTWTEKARMFTGRQPAWLAISPDKSTVLVAHELAPPHRWPEAPVAEVVIIDSTSQRISGVIKLPGTNLLNGISFSHSGDLALVPLLEPKNLLPAVKSDVGWLVTNALGVISFPERRIAILPLDDADHAYADPTGIAITPDDRLAFISHAGHDIVSAIDLTAVRRLVQGDDATLHSARRGYATEFGVVIKRIETGTNPGALTVSPDGRMLFVAERLDDTIGIISVETLERVGEIKLGGPKYVTLKRLGEYYFNGAGDSVSCRTCHPRGGTDGMQYDFEPDGIGWDIVDNRPLLGVKGTEPLRWDGGSPSLFRHCGMGFKRAISRDDSFTPSQVLALVTYVNSLDIEHRPKRFPLTPERVRGRMIFERTLMRDGSLIPVEKRCITCHVPPKYTDNKSYDVGTGSSTDKTSFFDVPHLLGLADTAPYLHDGRALTIEEIFSMYNPNDQHGITSDLTPDEIKALAAYLETL